MHNYFEAIELASGEIDKRFDQSDINTIRAIESLLLDAANGKSVLISEDLHTYLNGDVDQERLKTQLSMVKDAIKTSSIAIKKTEQLVMQ